METARLAFVTNRDGLEAAVAFARRTLIVYRASLFRSRKRGFNPPHHASLVEYRRGFILSCLSFRSFIRSNKKNE